MAIPTHLPRMSVAAVLLAVLVRPSPAAPPVSIPLTPDAWIATDSIRFGTYLGRPAMYINRGVALSRDAQMENGIIDMDMAATEATNFLGVAFRAANPRFSNVLFLRPRFSGTEESVQYGPAFNNLGVAWQVYHGAGANAVALIPRKQWFHLRIELEGAVARLFVDTATAPTLVVPRVVESGGGGIGVWTGAFGRGAWFSDIRYTPAPASAVVPAPAAPSGTILQWDISGPVEAAAFTPSTLPDLTKLDWQPVRAEPEGIVLLNRFREAPLCGVPTDNTGAVMADSVMTGRFDGARVVYARSTITAAREEIRRLQYAYANGAVIYLNGRPLAFDMNPGGLRASLASMARVGDAVYLPLKRGENQLVFAVIQCTGGWAFSARLDPQ